MKITGLFKFEPISITQIVVTISVVLIVIVSFKTQLNDFVGTLRERPITVEMNDSGTIIRLDAPATPDPLPDAISNPDVTQDQLRAWEDAVRNINSVEGFAKSGFKQLYEKLSALGAGDAAVINYQVNDPRKNYFGDKSMLRYLAIASEKVKYLAFYDGNEFVGAIEIQAAISGLASHKQEFEEFGSRLKNGSWVEFPSLMSGEDILFKNPSIGELQEYLTKSRLNELPLVENGRLAGFLNHKSIADELYAQASG